MDITPLTSKTAQVIESYGESGFTIAGTRYPHSVLVFPNQTLPWNAASLPEITADSLAEIIRHAEDIEILLVGTGNAFTPIKLIQETLRPHGITVDAMDTGAACRTFNILLLEGRKVAAALIAV